MGRQQKINVNNPLLLRADIASAIHMKVSIILIFRGFSALFMCMFYVYSRVSAAALLHHCVLKRRRKNFPLFSIRC